MDIEKGCPNGEAYTLHGEGDCVPDVDPGDVIVSVSVRKNKTFTRKGADLFYEKEITLLQSLSGVDFLIMHLDGRVIRVQSEKGQIIKPDATMTVEGMGMPFHKTSYKNGNLFIKFTVSFPDAVDANQMM